MSSRYYGRCKIQSQPFIPLMRWSHFDIGYHTCYRESHYNFFSKEFSAIYIFFTLWLAFNIPNKQTNSILIKGFTTYTWKLFFLSAVMVKFRKQYLSWVLKSIFVFHSSWCHSYSLRNSFTPCSTVVIYYLCLVPTISYICSSKKVERPPSTIFYCIILIKENFNSQKFWCMRKMSFSRIKRACKEFYFCFFYPVY